VLAVTKHCGYWRESSGLDVTAARTKHLAHNELRILERCSRQAARHDDFNPKDSVRAACG